MFVTVVVLLIVSQLGLGGETVSDKIVRLNDHATAASGAAIQKWFLHEPLEPDDKADLGLGAKDFEQILALNPNAWDKRFSLAAIYSALEDWEKAGKNIDIALANPPAKPKPADLVTIGELHYLNSVRWFMSNKPDKAETEATEALKTTKDENYYFARAQARAQLHNLEGAQQDCQEALKLNPDDERVTGLIKFMQNMH